MRFQKIMISLKKYIKKVVLKMKYLCYLGKEKFFYNSKNISTKLNPKEVLIKVSACGLCGSDKTKLFLEDAIDKSPNVDTLGHEVTGIVLEVGCEVPYTEIGKYVVIQPFKGCGKCGYCKIGKEYFCQEKSVLGYNINGGMAEYIIVNYNMIYELNSNIPLVLGTLVDPLAVAVHTLSTIPRNTGEVLIIGSGTIALMVAILLKYEYDIDVSIMVNSKEQMRKIDKITSEVNIKVFQNEDQRIQYDLVIEAVGGEQVHTFLTAMQKVKLGGRIRVIGAFSSTTDITLNLRQLFYKEIDILGINSYETSKENNDFLLAIQLLEKYSLVWKKLITHQVPLRNASTFLNMLKLKKISPSPIKTVFFME